MLKVSRADVGANDDDKIELSLDLSIGGSYGKSEKIEEDKGVPIPSKNDKNCEEFLVQRSGFSFSETSGNELESRSGSESADSKRKKEIQALRRQEARRKRDEKIKKSANSRGVPSGSAFCFGVANADDKLQLKIQQLKAKTRERETRENEGALLETARKKEKFDQIVENHLVKESTQEEQSNGSEIGNKKDASNENLERSSSVVYDHRSTSGRGGIGDKVGSNSKCSKANELLSLASASSDGLDQRDDNDASPNTGERNYATRMRGQQPLVKCLSAESQCSSIEAAVSNRPVAPPCKASKTTSTSEAMSIVKPKSGVVTNPPKLQGGNHGMASLAAMPCVSTTGNGPDGKTITGILYRYSKTDVCIVCACHGKSHTPAEFVEHAGGIGVAHPLRHITMMPSSME